MVPVAMAITVAMLLIATNSGSVLLNADISLAGGDSTGTGYYRWLAAGVLFISMQRFRLRTLGSGVQAPVEGIRIAGNIDFYRRQPAMLTGGAGGLF